MKNWIAVLIVGLSFLDVAMADSQLVPKAVEDSAISLAKENVRTSVIRIDPESPGFCEPTGYRTKVCWS